jgi:hypothetical protein
MMHGKDLYISNFGETMLTWEIIKDVCTSISYFLDSVKTDQPKYLKNVELSNQMEKVYKDIANIMNVAAQMNREALDLD